MNVLRLFVKRVGSMLNIRELEDLRTKEELINYFKAMGKNITEEEIDALKKSYEQAQENNSTLTMQQLDDVAGGLFFCNIVCAQIIKLMNQI